MGSDRQSLLGVGVLMQHTVAFFDGASRFAVDVNVTAHMWECVTPCVYIANRHIQVKTYTGSQYATDLYTMLFGRPELVEMWGRDGPGGPRNKWSEQSLLYKGLWGFREHPNRKYI